MTAELSQGLTDIINDVVRQYVLKEVVLMQEPRQYINDP